MAVRSSDRQHGRPTVTIQSTQLVYGRTDRPTDGQTTYHRNTALCVASRGKNNIVKLSLNKGSMNTST